MEEETTEQIQQGSPVTETSSGTVQNDKESDLLSWDASEYRTYERDWKWYAIVAAVSLGIIGYSIYTKDWFIIALVIVVDVFLFLYSKKQPRMFHYRVTQLGLYVGEHFYPYSEIHSFWLSLREKERKLNVIFMKKYLPQLTILIDDIDALQVKTILGKYIPEQENRSETIVDFFLRILKLQ